MSFIAFRATRFAPLMRWVRASVLASSVLVAAAPSMVARADDVAEASVLFARGNELFQRAMRLRGERRRRELESALALYVDSLARVRSRNVLYNAALVLEALERIPEAYNHWSEYLAIEGLTEAERADGLQRRDALRPRVAAFEIESSTPAEVWVDRRDLGSRGRTPLSIALPEGEHVFYFTADGHRETQVRASGILGETTRVRATLEPLPVSVQVLAPEGAVLEIDGERAVPGQSIPLPPGTHVARVSMGDRLFAERRFEVLVGAAPLVLDMTSALGATAAAPGLLEVLVPVAARLEIDGVAMGEGETVRAMVSPGPHHLRVSAPGRRDWTGTHTFTTFPARLSVRLAEDTQDWVHVLRGVSGGLAALALVGGVGTLFLASVAHDENLRNPVDSTADRLAAATLAVDVTWSVTAALGAAAIGLLFVDAGGGESTATLSFEPTLGGMTAAACGRIGRWQ